MGKDEGFYFALRKLIAVQRIKLLVYTCPIDLIIQMTLQYSPIASIHCRIIKLLSYKPSFQEQQSQATTLLQSTMMMMHFITMEPNDFIQQILVICAARS